MDVVKEPELSSWQCPLCREAATGRIARRGECSLPGGRAFRYALVECSACGLQRLEPPPPPTVMTSLYDTDYASYSPTLNDAATTARRLKMAVGRLGGFAMRHNERRVVAGAANVIVRCAELAAGHVLPLTTRFPLSLSRTAAILDYGSGAGGWIRAMRDAGYSKLWAFDIEHPGLDRLRKEGFNVLTAPSTLPASTFDCVRLEHALEHLADPVAAMQDVARALVPGGSAVVALPHIAARTARAMGVSWPALSLPYHLSHFTVPALRALATRAGLQVREIQMIPYWEIGYAALRAREPGLPTTPSRMWKISYLRRCASEREGDCVAVRMLRPSVADSSGSS